jgi:hypothetical protein
MGIAIVAIIMTIISFVGLHNQKECFINQNDYCVVLNKDSHLRPQLIGKTVMPIRIDQINTIGLTTQDTITIDVSRCLFDDIEIGDTIKTIKLR